MKNFFTREELLFFHANGFVVKRGVIDKEKCREMTNIAWNFLPQSFSIQDIKTWKGEVTCSCCVTQDLKKRRGHIRIRKESIGQYHQAQELVPKNKVVIAMVNELLGGELELAPAIFRGLYFTFPIPRLFSYPHYGHIESHPFQVGTITYCSDVKKDGGGLSVWPGSHWRFHNTFDKKIGFYSNENYKACAKYYNSIKPLTIEGDAGDIIFTHHRLYHAPSNNNNDTPRAAFFCDFRGENWPDLEQEKSSADPFETFSTFRDVSRYQSENFLTSQYEKPELLRVLSSRYPFLNRLYKKYVGNKTTITRSNISFKARFDK